MLNEKEAVRKAEGYLYLEVALWGLFPVLARLTGATLSPFVNAGISQLIGTIFFAFILTWKNEWRRVPSRRALRDILIATIVIGVLFYAFVFLGISKTNANDASMMLLVEVFFAIAILGFLKREKISSSLIFGSVCMVFGALLILFDGSAHFNFGNLIVLGATALPPFANWLAQRVRDTTSSAWIMFVRNGLSGLILLGMGRFFEGPFLWADVTASWKMLLLSGILVFGLSKILWLEALHRLPVTKSTAYQSLSPAFTMLFSFLLIGSYPEWRQIFGLVPILIGTWILAGRGRDRIAMEQ